MPFRRRRMPFRRTLRRPVFRRRRVRRIPRPRISSPNKTYSFKQKSQLNALTAVAGTTTGFGYTFQLSDTSGGNLTAFNSLYDQYRINCVVITFYPQNTMSFAPPSGTDFGMPEIYTVIDYDTATPPSGSTVITQLTAYNSCRQQLFNRPHSRKIKPMPLYTATTLVGAAPGATCGNASRKTWLNVSNNVIQYFGIRGAITNANPSNLPAMSINIVVTYYLQFRNVV